MSRFQFVFYLLLVSFFFGSCKKEVSTKILVLGDVQLASTIQKWNKEEWEKQKIDSTKLPKFINEVLSKEKPDYIFQTGDWVNYNNNLSLQIVDTLGNIVEPAMKLPYDEWEFMHKIMPTHYKDRFYIAIGNHESYKDILLEGVRVPGVDKLANINSIKFDLFIPSKKKELLLEQFPHLETAIFHKETGTYFLEKENFSLLSIDGIDKDRNELLMFIEKHLSEVRKKDTSKKLFVISHYPIFTGLPKEKDSRLAYSDIREQLILLFDKYNVDIFMNGHEHFYLRYTREGMIKAGFEKPYPEKTVYITNSNFVNPYGRVLERISPDTIDDSIIYFSGIHYSLIEIQNDTLTLVTYGYDEESKTWSIIDQF